jgi:hypothetical protein
MVLSSQRWRYIGSVMTLRCLILIGVVSQAQIASASAQIQIPRDVLQPMDSTTSNLALSTVQN